LWARTGPGTDRRGKKENGLLTSGPQANSILFQNSNSAQTGKFKMEDFHCSKNIQNLPSARFEYFEQLFQLNQLKIPNRIHVINFGTYSNLNLLFNFKRISILLEKSEKFSNILF
jgi:hypothetical protein